MNKKKGGIMKNEKEKRILKIEEENGINMVEENIFGDLKKQKKKIMEEMEGFESVMKIGSL